VFICVYLWLKMGCVVATKERRMSSWWSHTTAAAAFVSLVTGVSAAGAQEYPAKPVRIIVPFAPGGVTDNSARVIAEPLAARLGQQVIVENRPGASGNIGTQAVAQSAPDGYTLVLGFDGTMVINPHVFPKLPFDTLRDFAPVTKLGDAALLLVSHPSVPARNLVEFVVFARKAKSATFPYGTSGTGGTPHLAGELLKQRTGIPLEHIPYKGGGQAIIDVMGGQIPLVFTAIATAQQYVKARRLTGLGVPGAKRSPALPDVPTFIESGQPGFDVTSWVSILAPTKTPRSVVDKLQREIVAVLRTDPVRERYLVLGIEPVGNTPEQFAEQIRTDLARWEKVVKAANIRIE
jgi:tripartite-type tricarboxylate transporter receptor subunit TctC